MLGTKKYKTKNGKVVVIIQKTTIGTYVADSEEGHQFYDLNGNSLTDPDWDLIEGILPKPT